MSRKIVLGSAFALVGLLASGAVWAAEAVASCCGCGCCGIG